MRISDWSSDVCSSDLTRRTTFGLTVDRSGELVIHAPESSNLRELTRWTRSKLLWVHRKLLNKAEVAPRVREPEFVRGEDRKRVVSGKSVSVRVDLGGRGIIKKRISHKKIIKKK